MAGLTPTFVHCASNEWNVPIDDEETPPLKKRARIRDRVYRQRKELEQIKHAKVKHQSEEFVSVESTKAQIEEAATRRRERVAELEAKRDSLTEEKHKLFLVLKKVMYLEQEKQRAADAKAQQLREEDERRRFLEQQAVIANANQQDGSMPRSSSVPTDMNRIYDPTTRGVQYGSPQLDRSRAPMGRGAPISRTPYPMYGGSHPAYPHRPAMHSPWQSPEAGRGRGRGDGRGSYHVQQAPPRTYGGPPRDRKAGHIPPPPLGRGTPSTPYGGSRASTPSTPYGSSRDKGRSGRSRRWR